MKITYMDKEYESEYSPKNSCEGCDGRNLPSSFCDATKGCQNKIFKEITEKTHVHHDLIVQWAKNPELKFEVYRPGDGVWVDVVVLAWHDTAIYRIKKEKKVTYLYTHARYIEMTKAETELKCVVFDKETYMYKPYFKYTLINDKINNVELIK